MCRVANSTVSTTRRMEGSGGKMYSFWAMYSLRISFCKVPPNSCNGAPCCSATAIYMAQMMAAGLFIVMEVVTWPNGMPSKRVSMSAKEDTATPHLPNSPSALGSSVS